MIKLPASFNLGAHTYTVEMVRDFPDNPAHLGRISSTFSNIKVATQHNERSLPESCILQAYMHELLHACAALVGSDVFDGRKGENTLDALAEGMAQIYSTGGLEIDMENKDAKFHKR